MRNLSKEQEDAIIDEILFSFENYNLRDIKEINSKEQELEFTIAVFTLCSCFIDQLSGFRYATEKVKSRYIKFVKNYLPAYDADDLIEDLRNRLVHNYSIGSHYALSRHNSPAFANHPEYKVLILDKFIKDLEDCFTKYKEDIKNDPQVRHNALEWYSKYKIIRAVST